MFRSECASWNSSIRAEPYKTTARRFSPAASCRRCTNSLRSFSLSIVRLIALTNSDYQLPLTSFRSPASACSATAEDPPPKPPNPPPPQPPPPHPPMGPIQPPPPVSVDRCDRSSSPSAIVGSAAAASRQKNQQQKKQANRLAGGMPEMDGSSSIGLLHARQAALPGSASRRDPAAITLAICDVICSSAGAVLILAQ